MTPYDFWKTTPPDDDETPCEFLEQAERELDEAEAAGAQIDYATRDEWISNRGWELYQYAIEDGEEGRAEAAQLRREMDMEAY